MNSSQSLRNIALLALVVMISACGGAGSPTAPAPVPTPITVTSVKLGPTPTSGTVTTYGFNIGVVLSYQVADTDMPLGDNAWVASCISNDGSTCLSGAGALKKITIQTSSVDLMIGLPSTFTHDNPFGGIITNTKYILSFVSKNGDPYNGGQRLTSEMVERSIQYHQ